MPTLKQMCNTLAVRLSEQVANPILDAKLTMFINDATAEFDRAANWAFAQADGKINLNLGQQEYDLKADVVDDAGTIVTDVGRLHDQEMKLMPGQKKLFYLNPKDVDLVIKYPNVKGVPQWYGLRGKDQLQFYPVPNSVALRDFPFVRFVYYRDVSSPLVGESERTHLPNYAVSVMLNLAEYYALLMMSSEQRAQLSLGRYERGLQLLMENNRKAVEGGLRDIIFTQPMDQRQRRGVDQRIRG